MGNYEKKWTWPNPVLNHGSNIDYNEEAKIFVSSLREIFQSEKELFLKLFTEKVEINCDENDYSFTVLSNKRYTTSLKILNYALSKAFNKKIVLFREINENGEEEVTDIGYIKAK